MSNTENPKSAPKADSVQGEGDYEAARRFDAEERAFVESGAVDKAAKDAAEALDGAEADDLEAARVSTGKGGTGKTAEG